MLLFVYGTLQRGLPLHSCLEIPQIQASFLIKTKTAPRYTLLSLGAYPGLLPIGNTSVHGELYSVPKELIPILDDVEGHPHLFRRGYVELESGQRATTYFFNRIVKNGNYRDRLAKIAKTQKEQKP